MLINGYLVNEELFSNEHFILYRGLSPNKERVLIKVCRSEKPSVTQLAGLKHEDQVLNSLKLKNIPQVLDLIKHSYQLMLILKDIPGKSLHTYIDHKPLVLEIFFDIALQLTKIMGDLHQNRIIHKDINPHNIIINPDNCEIKLINFNICSKLNEESSAEYRPITQLEGNLSYLSPEQTGRMNRPIDYRSDFYSLGITFFELLTGALPFNTKDTLELVYHHMAQIPPMVDEINPQVPTQLSTIIAKLLAKIPEERYSSAAGIKVDLVRCQEQWEKEGAIDLFELGTQDLIDKLNISHKLYGREKETAQLIDTFSKISQGTNALLLVAGYSGIGKSSLIQEIRKPVLGKKGYFISGKFDQLQRVLPYSAFIESFKDLVKQLLSEPPEYTEKLKARLLKALENNGQIIVNIVPSIEQLIGPQPPLTQLPLVQEQNRFTYTLEAFICALANKEHPLVLFLDDLQWIDNASLNLLLAILSNSSATHLLIIGAYRENEVSEEHPLMKALQELRHKQTYISEILLLPLEKIHIQELLADSLNMRLVQVEPLAHLLFDKTQGNPFYLNVFLKKIYQLKLLKLDFDSSLWQWDLSKIKQQKVTDNVVDLLISNLNELPESELQILKIASCIGHIFELQTLSIITDTPVLDIAKALKAAINLNLVKPLNENYELIESVSDISLLGDINFHFVHDKVQQTTYQMIPKESLPEIHLRIGRMLLKNEPIESNSKNLFDTLNHLNLGIDLIDSEDEKKYLANGNFLAGIKAKGSIAYAAAVNYLKTASFLLQEDTLENKNIKFEIYKNIAECYYLLGDLVSAENYFQTLLAEYSEKTQRGEVFLIKIKAYVNMGKHFEAIALTSQILKEFNFHLPKKTTTLHVLKEVAQIEIKNALSVRKTPMVEAKSVEVLLINKILSTSLSSCYLVDQNLFAVITCKLIKLAYNKGYTIDTPVSCLFYAIILIANLNKIDRGFEFVKLAKQIDEHFPNNSNQSKINFILGNFIQHWKYPFESGLQHLNQGYQIGIEEGDLAYAGYSCLFSLLLHYLGYPLAEVLEATERCIKFLARSGDKDWHTYFKYLNKSLALLIPNSEYKQEYLKANIDGLPANTSKTCVALSYNIAGQISYIYNNFEDALTYSTQAYQLKQYIVGSFDSAFALFFHGLNLASCYPKADGSNKKAYLMQALKIQKQIKFFSRFNDIYTPFHALLSAEIISITKGFSTEALNYYNQAHTLFQAANSTYFLAITNECIGLYYLKFNNTKLAQNYFVDAFYTYSRWGAVSKCYQLKQKYPQWLQNENIGAAGINLNSQSNIDLLSLFKLSKTISSEIKLEGLLKKLIIILLQNAGAQRAVLMVKIKDIWYLQAEGSDTQQKLYLTTEIPLDAYKGAPVQLIKYAERLMDTVVMQSDKDFEDININDPYILNIKPKSILIIPISYQGKLQNLLYLENKISTYAFPVERMQALNMIASQAAVSLENARLYHEATHDLLTGLANRSLLYQMFDYFAARAARENKLIGVIFMDLDFFKTINDTLGHDVGDKLLIYYADKLKEVLRKDSMAVRLGGDEFVIMLDGLNSRTEVEAVVKRLYKTFKKPAHILNHEISISTSMGVSFYPTDAKDIPSLLKFSDIALYKAKNLGKNNCQYYY